MESKDSVGFKNIKEQVVEFGRARDLEIQFSIKRDPPVSVAPRRKDPLHLAPRTGEEIWSPDLLDAGNPRDLTQEARAAESGGRAVNPSSIVLSAVVLADILVRLAREVTGLIFAVGFLHISHVGRAV